MKDGNIEILDLDFEYKLWKNKLQFYHKELELMKRRVEVLEKEQAGFSFNEKQHITLDKQQEALELVKNKIKTMEFEMGYYAVDYPISSKHSHYTEHEKIRTNIERINDAQQYILHNIYPLLCFPFNPK
jgi:stress response protein YsnF